MNFSDALSAVTTPLWVGGLVSFALSVLVVLTTRWHGFLSLDESAGVQKVHAHPTPRVGGLPMVLGLLAAVMVSPAELSDKLWPWLLAGSPAFAFGLAEDLTKRVGVMARLLATMGSGVLAWFITGYALSSVNVWGLDYLRHQHPGHPDRLHFHSLFKRRVMQGLLPRSSHTVRNSVGGALVGGMSLLPAMLIQFTYNSTVLSIAAIVTLVLGYLWLFKVMVRRFGA